MGGECAEALLNALFISNISKYLIKYRQFRSFPGRDVKT